MWDSHLLKAKPGLYRPSLGVPLFRYYFAGWCFYAPVLLFLSALLLRACFSSSFYNFTIAKDTVRQFPFDLIISAIIFFVLMLLPSTKVRFLLQSRRETSHALYCCFVATSKTIRGIVQFNAMQLLL